MRATSTGWRSRSISPCSARLTIRGCPRIRNGSASAPDGSIRFSENPPKKYEDIVNPDFTCADRIALWEALRKVVLFWCDQGVRIFRVDNPHTKPFPFWEWLIREVRAKHPDVIFLSEAFTRPKVMKALAKLGFSQSYTYFTWRTAKEELQAYLSEITGYPEREYFRPNFFVTTPDILPCSCRAASPGCSNRARRSRRHCHRITESITGSNCSSTSRSPAARNLDSKYEIKMRDWDAPATSRIISPG